ncbi:hypothetical protein FZEAL_9387 [Fusarium zealandicum]|uniref:Uncharacterized protein n=1 Tax=Fusarium zealandicum TaxID=1053134 RepID=A0A8H4UBV5_9HYPO|nr:hypothetical protein FZEAL_9387 [Fusarium zealandicum]
MDGTYNNPYAQAQSPLSPQTPSTGAYQVNVNRSKTRKWVQAPVQNYDGDDWGADEFEDDDEPPPPPVPRVTTGLRSVGQRLASESHGPSPRLAAAVASSSRSSSGPPSLHIQTQHPAVASPAASARIPEQVQNVAGRTGSPAPASAGAGSSNAPSYHQPDLRSSTPQSNASSAARASPSIRPSEMYRHVEDERKLGGSPLSIAEAIAAKPSARPTPPLNEPSQRSYHQDDGQTNRPVRKQPTFDTILAKSEEPSAVQQTSSNVPASDRPPAPQAVVDQKDEPAIHSPSGIDRTGMSVSPQLPDVTRMSGFGADFFSPPNREGSDASPARQDPVKQEQTSVPAPADPATQSDKDLGQDAGTSSDTSQDKMDSSRVPALNQAPALLPAMDPRSIPPLRTPSPHSKVQMPEAGVSASESPSAASGFPHTEPLQPRVPEYSPSDYEPHSANRQNTFSTMNSSPVKESDVLSEEIMRTLSPIASNSALSAQPQNPQSLSAGGQADLRNSSYTLSDYDNYWDDTIEKAAQESGNEAEEQKEQKMPQSVPTPGPVEQPLLAEHHIPGSFPPETPPVAQTDSSEQEQADLRRRFSWEAGFDRNSSPLKSESSVDTSSKTEIPVINPPSPPAQSETQPPSGLLSDMTSPGRDSPGTSETPRIIVPPSGGISHQVSNASTLPPTQQAATIEPPSPISVKTDESTAQAFENRDASPTNDAALVQTPSNAVSMTSPRGRSNTLALSASELPQTTPFRDVMNLSTPLQRTLKFDQGRSAFSTWESGLENWLSNLMTQHPEYASANASFSPVTLPPSSQGGHVSTPSGSQPHAQQPYYQQYLNASSPTATAPAAGRSRLGGLPLPTPSGPSAFGNSSNQIGTKSKEFMHSAGKMGKGLLSKGRSKLRGTGDKGEPIPPPVQFKPKTERRSSWGLSLGPKSRPDEPAAHSEKNMMSSRPSTQPHQAIPSQPSNMPPFGPAHPSSEPGRRLVSQESQVSQPMNEPTAVSNRGETDEMQWYIPTPVSPDNATWDPFKGTDLGKVHTSEHSGVHLGNHEGQQQQNRAMEVPFSKSLSGNATPTPGNTGISMVPPGPPASWSQQPLSTYAAVTSQDTRVGVPPQAQNNTAIPQRHSSFVGLPLIRRGSTFDVNSKHPEPIDERVSLDAEEEEADRQHGTLTSEATVGSTLVGSDSLMQGKDIDDDDDLQKPVQTGVQGDQQVPAQQQRQSFQQQPPQQMHQYHQHPFQMHPVHQGPMAPQNHPFGSQPMMPSSMTGNPVQRLPPSGPWKLEESHLSEPLHQVTPKLPQASPSGPWKLEESHLAEPLQPVNRNRSGTNSSQQEPYFGYDKETGIDLPSPSSSTTQQYQQRQKPAEVPPSSANRFPQLFPGQQRPQSNSQEGPPGPGSQFSRRFSQDGIARTGTGEPEVANEERGRSRKASALLKDIGSRFRMGSSERRGSSVEPKPQLLQQPQRHQATGSQADAASEYSVTTEDNQERKKARSSFMLGLRNKVPTDHARQQSRDGISMAPPRSAESRPDTSPEERRISRFNTGLGVFTGHNKPSGPPRASTSNLAHEFFHSGSATPPPKKRFSGFNTKAAVAGVFHRPSVDLTPKPGTPSSRRPASSQQLSQQPIALERPNFPPGFERSNTAGPLHGMMQPTPTGTPLVDAPERRKRRGSAAGLISGLLGHGKNKEQHQSAAAGPPPGQQPPMQQPHSQPQGPPQIRHSSVPQLPSPQLPGSRLSSPQLPGSKAGSPQFPGSQFAGHQASSPPLASPQPQRPQQFGNQQPAMFSRTTGNSSFLENQVPASPDRPSSGGFRQQQSQVAYQNSRPSPLGHGFTTTPAGSPAIGSTNFPSGRGTPQTPSSVGQAPPDTRFGRMRSTSPAVSAIRTAPVAQYSYHNPTQSLDKAVRPGHEGNQVERPVADSLNTSFRSDARPGNGHVERVNKDELPQSPVSQLSKTGPPSVSSMGMSQQSPRLNTSVATMGRRESSQLSQASLPNTPSMSVASHTPPTQSQAFANRMGRSPQQQFPQQFPPGFQQQPMNPQQGGYQIVPGQQWQGGFRGQPGQQPVPNHHPQASMTPGRSPMQMQHPPGPPQDPPKDSMGPPPQPQAMNAPARQDSPASKWKGLKSRMSGQVAHKQSPSQGKTEGDKLSAGKILGAFKRSSKVPQQAQVSPGPAQAYQRGPPIQPMQHGQHGQYPQQFAPYGPHGEPQTPQQSSQYGSPPIGQMQGSRQASQFSNPPIGQPQTPRQSSQLNSPPMSQHQFQKSPGPMLQGQPGVPQPQGQWHPQMQAPGGQFAPGHVQQGYYPVQGRGVAGQTPNMPLSQTPHPQQQGPTMQQSIPQQDGPVMHHPVPVHPPSPFRMMQQASMRLPQNPHSSNAREDQVNQGGPTGSTYQSSTADVGQPGAPNLQRLVSEESQHGGSSPLPPVQHTSPRIGTSENDATKAPAPVNYAPAAAAASAAGVSAATVANENLVSRPDGSRALSMSPRTATIGLFSPANPHSAVSDKAQTENKDRPANIEQSGTRNKAVSPESNGNGAAIKAGPQVPAFQAELENTEDARKRRIRLDTQEEKIHYDPNADSDGEAAPQMSATSYPGQEWNPYGVPDYGEWHD